MIRALIFDLDGTLVHSLPGLTSSLNRVLSVRGFSQYTEDDVRGFIGNGIKKLVERALPKDIDSSELETLIAAMSSDYAQSWQSGTLLYPGVAETLEQLQQKGLPLAVFSNKPDEFCREITDFLLPDISFVEVRGQRKDTPVKPSPEGAFEVAKQLGISPESIAFVGDSTVDILTARNAKMLPITATWGYHDLSALLEKKPPHLIDNIEELPALIN